jgi:hypothetical protein
MPETDVDTEVDLDRIAWNLPPALEPQPPQHAKPSSLEEQDEADEQRVA